MASSSNVSTIRQRTQKGKRGLWRLLALLTAATLAGCPAPATPAPDAPAPAKDPVSGTLEPTPAPICGTEFFNNESLVNTPLEGDWLGWSFWWNPEATRDDVEGDGGGFGVMMPYPPSEGEVVMLPFEAPTEQQSPDSFALTRPVVNFEVVDPQCTLIESFDPPIILYMAYTRDDLHKAGSESYPESPGNLAFAFWDDTIGWVKFKPDKNHYALLHWNDDQFEFWNGDTWVQACEGETCTISEVTIPEDVLNYVYEQVVTPFPGADGVAFVVVSSWGDRRIGCGY